MKTEADFEDGDIVVFSNKDKTADYTGSIDYSYGEEKAGYARVQIHFTETSDIGDTVYVPVDDIESIKVMHGFKFK